jgi:hypothetical protein
MSPASAYEAAVHGLCAAAGLDSAQAAAVAASGLMEVDGITVGLRCQDDPELLILVAGIGVPRPDREEQACASLLQAQLFVPAPSFCAFALDPSSGWLVIQAWIEPPRDALQSMQALAFVRAIAHRAAHWRRELQTWEALQ